jgi:hypothetical protein
MLTGSIEGGRDEIDGSAEEEGDEAKERTED